jgi:hypothetical protein
MSWGDLSDLLGSRISRNIPESMYPIRSFPLLVLTRNRICSFRTAASRACAEKPNLIPVSRDPTHSYERHDTNSWVRHRNLRASLEAWWEPKTEESPRICARHLPDISSIQCYTTLPSTPLLPHQPSTCNAACLFPTLGCAKGCTNALRYQMTSSQRRLQ